MEHDDFRGAETQRMMVSDWHYMDVDLALALDHPNVIITSGYFSIYPFHFQIISGDGDML